MLSSHVIAERNDVYGSDLIREQLFFSCLFLFENKSCSFKYARGNSVCKTSNFLTCTVDEEAEKIRYEFVDLTFYWNSPFSLY